MYHIYTNSKGGGLHKRRFTYYCGKEDIKVLKIIAADLRIPVNKLIYRAVKQYINSHYTPEQRKMLLQPLK